MTWARFEYYENVITKHKLNNISWKQAGQYGFSHDLGEEDVTVARVRMLDSDTVEILKRKDKNKSVLFKMGFDQMGLYERVIINRKEQTVAIDRIDGNWWHEVPFMGRRDLFYQSPDNSQALFFVRHNYWISKCYKFTAQSWSHFARWNYWRLFSQQIV